jgi:hypothetical protein
VELARGRLEINQIASVDAHIAAEEVGVLEDAILGRILITEVSVTHSDRHRRRGRYRTRRDRQPTEYESCRT